LTRVQDPRTDRKRVDDLAVTFEREEVKWEVERKSNVAGAKRDQRKGLAKVDLEEEEKLEDREGMRTELSHLRLAKASGILSATREVSSRPWILLISS